MGDFIPHLVSGMLGEREAEMRALLDAMEHEDFDSTPFVAPTAEARMQQELNRLQRVGLMYETVVDKYRNALKVHSLLHNPEAGFVLLLHGFSTVRLGIINGLDSAQETDIGLYRFRFDLAKQLAPAPLVLARAPSQSESLVGVFDGANEAQATTFALDLDDSWESRVEALIAAASFIVVRNPTVREGLRVELQLLDRLGRLDDTFFTDPSNAHAALPGKTLRSLDDEAIQSMRNHAATGRRSGALNVLPTCWWLQGEARESNARNVLWVFNLLNQWAERGQRMPLDVQTCFLAFAVAASLVHDRLDLMVISLASYAERIGRYDQERLPQAQALAAKYMGPVQSIAATLDAAQLAPAVFDYVDLAHLNELIAAETQEQLIPATMYAVYLMGQARTRA